MRDVRLLSLNSTAVRLCTLLLVASLVWSISPALLMAQSGRRAPKPNTPPPSATATTNPEPEGESESVPRGRAASRTNATQLSLLIYELDDPLLNAPLGSADYVFDGVMRRLRETPDVAITPGGKSDRKAARERAKNETDTFVVTMQLEEDTMTGQQSIGRADPATLILRYYVYAPRTGVLKTQGRVDQRPLRSTARVGGIRIPLPTPRGRTLSEFTLEQLGRDAADRIIASFNVRLPPEP